MCLSMRPRTYLLAVAATISSGWLLAASAQARDELLPGDYSGKANGIKATVTVDDFGDGTVKFAMKASCGTVRGSVDLEAATSGDLKGKRVTGKKTVVARFSPSRRTGVVSGSVRYVDAGGEEPCKGKRSLDAELDMADSPAVDELSGHYAGVGDDGGLPVSFDVGYDRGDRELEVSNLDFQTDTECWTDDEGDDEDLVARINDLSGDVDPDGYFEIDYMPDDDTEFYVEGQLEDGDADLYIEVGGFFGADGLPAAGVLECDSWGEDYFASKNG